MSSILKNGADMMWLLDKLEQTRGFSTNSRAIKAESITNSVRIGALETNSLSINDRNITATKLDLGGLTIEVGKAISCPRHGESKGIALIAKANGDTPTLKLESCKFCFLEKLAEK